MGAAGLLGKNQKPIRVKLLLIGSEGSGKSSLVARFKDEEFDESDEPRPDLALEQFSLNGKVGSLAVLDALTDGDLQLPCRLKCISNCHVVALVFDQTNEVSWLDIPKKLGLLQTHGYRNRGVLLVGTKCDLPSAVDFSLIQELVNSTTWLGITYIETSAKEGINVEEVFQKAFEIGEDAAGFRWDRIKPVLYVHAFGAVAEEPVPDMSWINLCEAIPRFLAPKETICRSIVSRMDRDTLAKLLTYL